VESNEPCERACHHSAQRLRTNCPHHSPKLQKHMDICLKNAKALKIRNLKKSHTHTHTQTHQTTKQRYYRTRQKKKRLCYSQNCRLYSSSPAHISTAFFTAASNSMPGDSSDSSSQYLCVTTPGYRLIQPPFPSLSNIVGLEHS